METKYILGVVIVLVLIGGAVGCSYVLSDPKDSSEDKKGNLTSQNTTNVTNTTNDTQKDTKKAEAKTVKQTCTNCGGDGYLKCGTCNGYGKTQVDCDQCSGPEITGKVSSFCCTKCNGAGVIKSDCKACGGDGKIPCGVCGGDGLVVVTVYR